MATLWTLGATAQAGLFHLACVTLSLAIVLLFAALHYSQIVLPEYTVSHPLKDAQQVVNLVVAVVAAFIGILLSHCLSLTNEAETAADLRRKKLTIPRLHTHVEAAGGSKTALAWAALNNKSILLLALFYLFAVTVLGGINSVLGVIFVLDAISSPNGVEMPVYVPLSADVPNPTAGEFKDPCRDGFADANCTYDLAMTSLSSELITHTPYTIGGVQFASPNGTLGLPYQVLKHFAENVTGSMFEEEYRQYCLPVLDPHIVRCTEEPFVQLWGETNSTRVEYKSLTVEEPFYEGKNYTEVLRKAGTDIYKVILNYVAAPATNPYNTTMVRNNDQGKGTMTIARSEMPGEEDLTIITASDSGGQGYAQLLHQMMYGNFSTMEYRKKWGADKFVAVCKLATLYNNTNHSSWRRVNFSLKSGVLKANVTEERCPNPRHEGFSGFPDIYRALQGATSVLSGSDGYSKLLNNNSEIGLGSSLFHNMSRLDAAMSKIYHIVQTAYSQTNYQLAMKNETMLSHPIMMTKYPHLYVIRISWTPTTAIGLTIAVLIALTSILLALRWLLAILRLGSDQHTWNLLRPVDLMAYSLAAYEDLIEKLDQPDHRRQMMKDAKGKALIEYPFREGTRSLLNLVRSNSPLQSRHVSPSTTLTAHSPLLASQEPTLNEKMMGNGKTRDGLGITTDETSSTISSRKS